MYLFVPFLPQFTLISEKFSPDLTSNVAAGIFLWGPKSPDAATDLDWFQNSWTWFTDLLSKARPWETGVSKLPVYIFSSHSQDQVERKMMEDMVPVYRLDRKRLRVLFPQLFLGIAPVQSSGWPSQ